MSFYPYSNSEFDTWITFDVVWVFELVWKAINACGFSGAGVGC